MGNKQSGNKYNNFIDFTLKLEKLCYYPGENISGTLYLIGKPGLKEAQLIEPKVLITMYERYDNYINHQKNRSVSGEILKKDENKYIFNSFKWANLLAGVNIPFSFRIPFSFNPSCLLYFISNSESLSHFFSAEFPLLKVKRTLPIVIKSSQNFTSKNGLLQISYAFNDRKTKSKFLSNNGDFSISVNLPKNVFYYDEPIPFEIKLDCKNLHILIIKLEVSI